MYDHDQIDYDAQPIANVQYYLDWEPVYWFLAVVGLIVLCTLYGIFG